MNLHKRLAAVLLVLIVTFLIGNSVTAQTTPSPVGNGTGLKGYYFNSLNFSNYKTERLDSKVDFYWQGNPITGLASDRFSVRWLGKIQPRYSEKYTFYTLSDDGVRLWVNNQLIIDKWIDQGATEHKGAINLTAGQKYDIKLEYYENAGSSRVKLSWSSLSLLKQMVPTSQLYPPATATATTTTTTSDLFGVNVAGGEFGTDLPGDLNTDYVYATTNYKYFADRNQKLIRIPFLWERLQPQAFGSLSTTNVSGLRKMLDTASVNGQKVILDLHNYARRYNVAMKKADSTKFADLWTKLATEFKSHPAIYGYELMNEPHDLPEGSDSWAFLAQAATTAIRKIDTTHYVIVPGYDWQSALRWQTSNPTLNVKDSANKLLYAAHVYFDKDQSGRYINSYDSEGVTANVGVNRLQPFITWLKNKSAKGIITEYGIPDNDSRYLTVLDNFMMEIKSEATLIGGTYWAGGPWWGSYKLSVEPRNGLDRPQMTILKKY